MFLPENTPPELPPMPEEKLSPREERMLNTLLIVPRKKMPLSVFEKDYLPFLSSVPVPKDVVAAMLDKMKRLTGDQNHTEADLVGNLLNSWMEYHQSPGAASMYVDIMQGDEVVYTVPPLLDERDIMKEGVDGRVLSEIANHTSNLSTIHANLADKYVQENLLPLVDRKAGNPEYLQMWNIIYKYHGLPLLKLEDGAFVSTNAIRGERQVRDGATIEASGAVSDLDEYD